MKTSIVITEAKTTASLLRTICQVLYMVLSWSLVYSKLRGIKQALLKLNRLTIFPQILPCPPFVLSSLQPSSSKKQRAIPTSRWRHGAVIQHSHSKFSAGNSSAVNHKMGGIGPLGSVPGSSQGEALQTQKAQLQT